MSKKPHDRKQQVQNQKPMLEKRIESVTLKRRESYQYDNKHEEQTNQEKVQAASETELRKLLVWLFLGLFALMIWDIADPRFDTSQKALSGLPWPVALMALCLIGLFGKNIIQAIGKALENIVSKIWK